MPNSIYITVIAVTLVIGLQNYSSDDIVIPPPSKLPIFETENSTPPPSDIPPDDL